MRSIIALDPRLFGRGPRYRMDGDPPVGASPAWLVDLRIFAVTFCGGFLFAAIYLA